ncbi:MAG: arginine--tRNA ligase [Chlorobi bacterium]|nr:arginine--tRNA ligase [Chlorobiota bacterium]
MKALLEPAIRRALRELYDLNLDSVELIPTKKGFEGDITFPVFFLAKTLRKPPAAIAAEVGDKLKELLPDTVGGYNVAGGFLNISLSPEFYTRFLREQTKRPGYGIRRPDPSLPGVMVEYSSPNTNKPLHLGHIRNSLLGYAVSAIIEATGKPVIRTQIINDRGIHISKSMVAWKKFGEGETPESSGIKGDHLVGKYYVEFDKQYRKEVKELAAQGMDEETAKREAPIMREAREMLKKWENGDPETLALWKMMNDWVLEGFRETYRELGVRFDTEYFESDTYLLGKKIVEEGLRKGIFYRKEDGSVWVDLSDEGLDEKLLLRADGTSVYITQDLGTAVKRFEEFDIDTLIYVVGSEQDYHFKVLFSILKKLGYPWADRLYHLSYGMVHLPEGKMKSREGTVVDADDLLQKMYDTARKISEELGKTEGFPPQEKEKIYKIIGKAALKYHLLKVDPRKDILFDPKKSIDFNGNTGPFLQYAYVRIRSLLHKAGDWQAEFAVPEQWDEKEKDLLKQIIQFPDIIRNAADTLNPAVVANYLYQLVKTYNSFYQALPVLQAPDSDTRARRLALSAVTGDVIKNGLALLGIEVPERM